MLIYDKSFQDISSGKMELFSSFFAALKIFIREIVLEGSKELKNIELGDYSVLITSIPDIKVDIVIIGDKEDHKLISKLIPKMIKILLQNATLFKEWKGNRDALTILEQPLSELIFSHGKLLGDKSLIEHPEAVLHSIWAHKKDLTEEESKNLAHEKEILTQEFNTCTIIPKKLKIVEKLIDIAEKTKDTQNFIKFQEHIKQLKDETRDIKIKINYYLEKIKSSINESIINLGNKPLNEGDYKDVYLNLYSFSNKLKSMREDDEWLKYRDLANNIINREEISIERLSETIKTVLNMKDSIEDYLK